jgi:rubrerythrin
MGNTFNPCEILEIAIDIEEHGRKLYESLQEKAKDEKVKETWAYLKNQEADHVKLFKDMLDERRKCMVQEFVPGEYSSYLEAIASEYVFTQKLVEQKSKESFASDIKAIEFGIQMEKESILVYSAFREVLTEPEQAALDKVIIQEREHLIKFTELKSYLKKGDSDGS